MGKPEPPPEATLLRLARMASGIRTPVAAAAAGISKARLSQIENGYEKRAGQYRSVSGSDAVIAHLAAVSGVTPRELDEAGRPVAASVLRIILARQETGPAVTGDALVADLLPPAVAEHWHNPYVRRLWEKLRDLDISQDQKLALIEDIARVRDGDGSGASTADRP